MERPYYNPRFHHRGLSASSYEEPSDVLITEPSLSHHPSEIFRRYVTGMPLDDIARPVFYDGEPYDAAREDDNNSEFIDPRFRQNQDLTDLADMREEMNGYITEHLKLVKNSDNSTVDQRSE